MAPMRRSVISSNNTNDSISFQPLTAEDVTNDLLRPSDNVPVTTTAAATNTSKLSIDQMYHSSKRTSRENHWLNNPYAVGLVEPTWKEEIQRGQSEEEQGSEANGPNRQCCSDVAEPEMDPTCGCLVFSGYVCSKLNAGRIGNMAVLKERYVVVDEIVEVEIDDNDQSENEKEKNDHDGDQQQIINANQTNTSANDENDIEEGQNTLTPLSPKKTKKVIRKVSKRQIDLIVGPYWPMMIFITYPLILAVSIWTAKSAIFIPNCNIAVVGIWSTMTFGLCFSLFNVAFRDPGILPKYKQIPKDGIGIDNNNRNNNNNIQRQRKQYWRWIDSAQSYAPRNAIYDPDCAVVVEEFDHTCPWTGTAIGKKNMFAFQCFIGSLFSCLILDIILITSSSITIP